MHPQLHIDEPAGPSAVSTGRLPNPDLVRALIAEAHQRYLADDEGTVADYIPARWPACRPACSASAWSA
jgi:hypothetical protein